MSDLKSILTEEYEKQEKLISPDKLIEMIEEVMSTPIASLLEGGAAGRFSGHIPLPKLVPNESWGNPDSQSRKDIDRIFASITRQPSIRARIDHVNSFVDPVRAERKGTGQRFNTILNMMMILEALQACLNYYSESSAGFVFEGFMAAVTGGKQIAGRVGGTLPIEDFVTGDGEPVSLKLLSPTTGIHGSFTNLVDFMFIRGGSGVPSIKYMIARKNSDGDDVSQLQISDFIISRENFVAIMTATNKNAALLGDVAGELEQHIQAWQDSPQWRLQMFQILQQVPGYDDKRGMFYKNLDAEGAFDELASEPADPAKKQDQYQKVSVRNLQTRAANDAEEIAAAGLEADFDSWLQKQQLQDEDPKAIKKWQKAYNDAYIEAMREIEQVAESYFGAFHEREKRLMQEEMLLAEGGGADGGRQWTITDVGMSKLRKTAAVEYYGELDLSKQNIKACADIYIEKLGENLMLLLKTTQDFTENIGKYFSADRRSTAMNANIQAQDEGRAIVKTLSEEAQASQKEPEIG